jgi:hypothetical protein
MALSEFSFKIEFIPGVNNDIADSISRLCRNNMIDFPQEYTPETIMSANIIKKFKLIVSNTIPLVKYTTRKWVIMVLSVSKTLRKFGSFSVSMSFGS